MKFFNKRSAIGIMIVLFFTVLVKDSIAQKMWDNRPAKAWMTDAYPIGNGRIGGMVFGGINKERIQLNDITLWTGNETERGTYQTLGNLFIDSGNGDDSEVPADYRRELDINRSVSTITYTKDGIKYKREYFCSFPGKVMVLRFTADKKGAFNNILRLTDAHGNQPEVTGDKLFFAGKLNNGMQYKAIASVKLEGGKLSSETDPTGGSQLKIENADAITILLTAATDFANDSKANWRGEAPGTKIDRVLKAALVKPYSTLLKDHIADYQQLFGRVHLNVGSTAAATLALPT
ncbi:MAG: glycoside hydrolase family 95 protein, partial [Mucilaginibacter sp.]|nr:glycoside hydrolase family 95 protein [Mucilaginibacter sp.]